MRASLLLLFSFPFLVGCASSKIVREDPSSSVNLRPQDIAYVALPDIAPVTDPTLHRAARIVSDEFDIHLARVTTGQSKETLGAALTSARRAGADYLVRFEILFWEDHEATLLSSVPDRVRGRIRIYDATSGDLLDSAQLESEGDPWLGREDPEDRLQEVVADYVTALFPDPRDR